MRQETNNEMDLLLRRLSRREGAPASDDELNSDHLDADELSSYAENVLPAAARARYMEHLAECSKCRELVVQLSASVPVVAAKQTTTAAVPSALRKFLASLFSPMVLRYAVPALGLIVVTAIGIVVYRSEQSGSTVAQLESKTAPAATPTQNPSSGFVDFDSQGQTKSQSPTATPETRAGRVKEAEPPPPSNTAPAATGATAEPKTDAPVQKPEEQPAATPTPAPPAAPKPAETVDEMRIEVEGRNPQPARGRIAPASVAKQSETGNFRDADKKSEDVAATQSSAKLKRTESKAQAGAGTFNVAQQEKDRGDGIMRTVAGRRFRKQDGVWVDTAYDSNSAVTNVARGSEQYRALIADEPTIKTIADQLDGPFVVVWKGRTYRIR